jgi:hypothetical protein
MLIEVALEIAQLGNRLIWQLQLKLAVQALE